MSIAKKNQYCLALEIGQRARLAMMVDKAEIPGEIGTGNIGCNKRLGRDTFIGTSG